MKKLLAVLLAVAMMLTFCVACGQTSEPTAPAQEPAQEPAAEAPAEEVEELGQLALSAMSEDEINEVWSELGDHKIHITYFDSLNPLLMALEYDKIDAIIDLPKVVGQYVVSHNTKVQMSEVTNVYDYAKKYHMGVLKENTELYDEVEAAIKAMIDDGTMAELADKFIEPYIDLMQEPESIAMPEFPGADTIKVAVTGDLPPFDFVRSDGKPAGFNVAVLSELSTRLGKNIELVTMDSASRIMALTSGTVDILFWVCESDVASEKYAGDVTDALSLTSTYFESTNCKLEMLK